MNAFRFLLCITLFIISFNAKSSHFSAGEITYRRYLSTNRYEIQAVIYIDISRTAPQEPYLDLYCIPGIGAYCNTAASNAFTVRLERQKIEYTIGSSCSTRSLVLKQTHTGVVTLPPSTWTLQITSNFRPGGIMNMTSSTYTPVNISATLDNTSGLFNNSPQFISHELPHTFYNNQYSLFTMQAVDVDRDSLSYEFIVPQQAPTYSSCPQPVSNFIQPHIFRLSSSNGKLEVIPSIIDQGFYTIAVRVNEFRQLNGSWRKIGSIQRDITYRMLTNSTNTNPSFTSFKRDNAVLDFDQAILVNPGRTITLTLATTDAEITQTRNTNVATPSIYNLSGSNLPYIQPLSSAESQLVWEVPAYLPVGRYVFSVIVADNFCPVEGREVRPVTFEVTNRVITTTKKTLENDMQAFPTPFHEQVQFQLTQHTAQSVTIVDGLGRTVDQLTSRPDGSVQWRPASTLAPGLYLARTADGQQQFRLLRE